MRRLIRTERKTTRKIRKDATHMSKLFLHQGLTLLLLLAALLGFAGCGPAPDAADPDAATPADAEPDVFPRVTITPTASEAAPAAPESAPGNNGYPASAAPTFTPLPDDYPAPPTPQPLPSAYDDVGSSEPVWVLYPVGEQCADAAASRYPDLTAAVAGLTATGVTVLDSELTDLEVCEACGCPTSAHYRLQIDAAGLETALDIGWTEEE